MSRPNDGESNADYCERRMIELIDGQPIVHDEGGQAKFAGYVDQIWDEIKAHEADIERRKPRRAPEYKPSKFGLSVYIGPHK